MSLGDSEFKGDVSGSKQDSTLGQTRIGAKQ